MSILRRTFCFWLIGALLFVTAHRLPAPIQEVPETPTPAPQQSAMPKPKRTIKPKVANENSESSTKRKTPAPTPRARFAGTWSGTVNVPNPLEGGDSNCTYVINAAENSVAETCERFNKNTSAATVNGNTISWNNGFFKEYNNALTLIGDGRTAQITITSSWGNGSGTVTRVASPPSSQPAPSASSSTPKPAPSTSRSELPVAKSVPHKPGFVYDPFDPNSKMLLDVRGKASGTKVKDPSGRLFIVP
jgi:hypothetical protein